MSSCADAAAGWTGRMLTGRCEPGLPIRSAPYSPIQTVENLNFVEKLRDIVGLYEISRRTLSSYIRTKFRDSTELSWTCP